MTDSHVHLNHPEFEADLDGVLARAAAAGVKQMLVPGYDLPSSRRAVELAAAYPQLVASVGVHPHDASGLDEAAVDELRGLARQRGVVAIGEIGLDFHYDLSPRPAQVTAFAWQIRLAHELRLPIIIHQREAEQAAMEVFLAERAQQLGGVWHCFSGGPELMDFAVEHGFCIGIAGPVTFRNASALAGLVPHLPADNLLIETDAPYLSPHPFRGQRNEPARLICIAEKLASLRGESGEDIAATTTANFRRLFRLDQ